MDILTRSQADAQSAKAKTETGDIVAGPFPVGNIGHVSVIEKTMGDRAYLYARFVGSGRPAQVPLAACAALVDALREDATEAPEAEDAPTEDAAEEDTPEDTTEDED